jgi:hypothetical protein
MAMSITCGNCGYENPLGRIFCGQCGKKIDLAAMTAQNVAERTAPSRVAAAGKIVFAVVLVLVLAILGLVCWPAAVSGDQGTRRGAQEAERKLGALQRAAKYGTRIGQSFNEKEINGYIVEKRPKSNVGAVASLSRSGYSICIVRRVGPFSLGKLTVPALSLTCTLRGASRDGRLTVASAAYGHLPMPAFLKAMPILTAKKYLPIDDRVREVSGAVSAITFSDGQVELVVPR